MIVFASTQSHACNLTNPYVQGSGHYAGFEWAKKKSVSICGGKSNSFIENCEEYLRQAKLCLNQSR